MTNERVPTSSQARVLAWVKRRGTIWFNNTPASAKTWLKCAEHGWLEAVGQLWQLTPSGKAALERWRKANENLAR